nr:DUF6456 domain-containing protein [Roseovarius faecimaris]
MPDWVPRPAVHYLAHTEAGLPIRELARGAGCHASTVLRQIRSFETRREDPLVDAALHRLGRRVFLRGTGSSREETRMIAHSAEHEADPALTEGELRQQALRVLRRLCESGALLVVADNMDKAVIVRESADNEPTRTGIVEKKVAEALALKGWLQCGKTGRITRYAISSAGRDALSRLMAEAENKALGFADAQARFDGPGHEAPPAQADPGPRRGRRRRYGGTESPLVVLARRRDKSGQSFLTDDLVRAGERLREDFELAQMESRGAQDWESYLDMPAVGDAPTEGSTARARVIGALRDLGPGLGDVALQCCCYLEGLERIEKRMNWSARSGKIVLRIALQRLRRHYEQLGEAARMIG